CSNCTLRVTVNGVSATLPISVSSPGPPPTPTSSVTPPPPTPTPTGGGGGGGTVSVSVSGPSSGSRGVPLTFTANASGGSPPYTYATSGARAARLTVAGNETTTPGTSSTTINIDISGPPAPSAAYTSDGATATGTDAYDIEATKQIVATATETKASKYDWDFGD